MLKLETPNAFRASTGVSPLKPQGVLVFSWVRDQSNLYVREYNLERPHTRRVRSRSLGYLTPADPENPSLFVEQRRVTLAAGTPSP